jgi:uroporphyrinogen decarboxylase
MARLHAFEFAQAKAFCFSQPEAAHALLQKITDATITYLKGQVRAGADVVQVFDSWGGLLAPGDYPHFSLPYIRQIVDALKEEVPVIAFGKGCWASLGQLADTGASALGIDWHTPPEAARQLAGTDITLQGNFDPSRLMSPIPEIQRMTREMIDRFGKDRYIANLGHGILPHIPVDHAKAFVDAVKGYQA